MMKNGRVVLVIDDEVKILELVKSYLEINGYRALCAKTGREGLALFEQHAVDLILLDLMLPGISGEELCRTVREVSGIPIIMLTARVDEESIINGLRIGADDYVCKPFSPRQLMARVDAAIRRSGGKDAANGGAKPEPVLVFDGLVLDTENRSVSRNGEPVNLTRDEYQILALLMSRQTKIFTREEIIASVKGDDYYGFDRTIDTHIKNLRAKIGDDSKKSRYIVTVYGVGYRFGAEH